MKEFFKKGSYLLLVLGIFLLVGCGNSSAKEVSFESQYIRTDGNVVEIDSPSVTKITSVQELMDYYNNNKDNYNFSDNSVDSISFITAIDKYDEDYFKDSFLVLVLVREDNGNVFHTVNKVTDNGNISIDRNLLDNDNQDIASWHIIIELDKKYSNIDYQVNLGKID